MPGTGRNHTLAEANQRLRFLTAELEHTQAEHDQLAARLRHIEAQRDRYHAALWRIADAESGPWGRVAHDALHPGRHLPPAA